MDERAFVSAVEEANLDELALLLSRPTVDEERILRLYLGPGRYKRMRNYAVRRSLTRGPGGSRGNVVLLPGVMGSELSSRDRAGADEPLWIMPLRVVFGALDRLKLTEDGRDDASEHVSIHATRVMQRYYGEAQLALAAGNWNVRAFAYDWRKELDQAADELNAQLGRWFDQDEPVHLVAHSMGGLVARTFIKYHPERWQKMWDAPGKGARGGRLIMLGVPNHGSFNVPRSIVGLEGIVRILDHADIFHTRIQLQQIMNGFPGLLQMMPSPLLSGQEDLDQLYDASLYPDLNVSNRHLRLALDHHRLLAEIVDPERMVNIAGTGQPTWSGINDFAHLADNASYELSNLGDGRITHEQMHLTANGANVPTYFLEEGHANLLANDGLLLSLNELLDRGQTSDLAQTVTTPAWTKDECMRARAALDLELQNDEKRTEEIVNRIRNQGGAARAPDSDFVAELARWRGGGDQPVVAGTQAIPPQISIDEGELADLITRDVLSRSVRATRSAITEPDATKLGLEIDLVVANIEDFESRDLPACAIAVGHYAGVLPQAAERALDDAMSGDPTKPGILTRFAQRGLIRGDLGQPFIIPDPRAPQDRLIVLAGMGLPGRFGAPELTILARELTWTMAELGCQHLATVLIGAGMGNLDQDVAVSCWLRGIATALDPRTVDLDFLDSQPSVRRTRTAPEMPFAKVRRITFVQRNPSNALNMLRQMRQSMPEIEEEHGLSISYLGPAEDELLKMITVERRKHLQKLVEQAEAEESGEAPRKRPDRDNLDSSTRITVGMAGNVYHFGAITSEAAIPEREISLDPGLVMSANNELAAESNPDLQLERGVFLQGLLMPAEVRTHLQTNEPVVMMLDATTARIHWEMIAQPDPTLTVSTLQDGVNRSGAGTMRKFERERFLGTSRGFTRQLRTPFATLPDPPAAPRKTMRVLVVADPSEDMPLAGAEAEGLEVADVFAAYNRAAQELGTGNRVVVDRLLGPREATRTTTLRYLMLRPYDVLHFAGHCFYQSDQPEASGWIFSNGETISAHELNRIDRIPRFVFSNACESGVTPDRSELRSEGLAPSFAEAFFARGVANFVCTAWPVDDSAARRFARTLYLSLLGLKEDKGVFRADGEPQPMHIAMQRARIELADRPSGARTWGAYQHYGNPNYRFFAVAGERQREGNEDSLRRQHPRSSASKPAEATSTNGTSGHDSAPHEDQKNPSRSSGKPKRAKSGQTRTP